jgi:CopG family transcriptional regulator/antitoxin EndoAI
MKSSTVNISFNDDLLRRIDELAKRESRSRSELIREAARAYIERSNRWKQIFDFAEKQATKRRISEEDVRQEIATYRSEAGRA